MKCCESCPECCCKDNTIDLTPRELKYFKENAPDLKYTTFGNMGVVRVKSCPFYIDKRCSIYQVRPLACASFPLTVKTNEEDEIIVWDIRCPKIPPANKGIMLERLLMLEQIGATPQELAHMLVAHMLARGEIKREYSLMSLKDHRYRLYGLKLKQDENELRYTWGVVKIPSKIFAFQLECAIQLLNSGNSYEKIFGMIIPILALSVQGKEAAQESIQTHLMISTIGWKSYMEKIKDLIAKNPGAKDGIMTIIAHCIPDFMSNREFIAIAHYLVGVEGNISRISQIKKDTEFLLHNPFARLPDEKKFK